MTPGHRQGSKRRKDRDWERTNKCQKRCPRMKKENVRGGEECFEKEGRLLGELREKQWTKE
jgi:hypothetical protein